MIQIRQLREGVVVNVPGHGIFAWEDGYVEWNPDDNLWVVHNSEGKECMEIPLTAAFVVREG
jgi:hypothetical protein